jgi:hypothetical protein
MSRKQLTAALNYCANNDLPDPWKKYTTNRASAKARRIDWTLTFDEWWLLWKDRYHLRGIGAGKMNLCRKGDVGGYTLDNVRIDTCEANQLEMLATYQARDLAKRIKRAAEKVDKPKRTVNKDSNHEWSERSMCFADPLEILLAKEAINAL